MPKSKQQKQELLASLVERIKTAKGVVFSNYMGLNVQSLEDLRKQLRKEGVELIVAKRTILEKALQENGFTAEMNNIDGGVALVTGPDEVQPAKIVHEFSKIHEQVKLCGGLLEGKFIDANQVSALAVLPSKDELLSKMVGSLNAPISGFVNVLAGNLRGLVNVLNSIKDKK